MTRLTSFLLFAFRHGSVLRALVLAMGLVLFLRGEFKVHSLDIEVEIETPTTAVAQVFYSFDGLSYYAEHNRIMERRKKDGRLILVSRIRTVDPIKTFRFDPTNVPGDIRWRSMKLTGNNSQIGYGPAELPALPRSLEELQIPPPGAGQDFQLIATGIDPKMVIDVPPQLIQRTWSQRLLGWAQMLGLAALLAGLVDILIRLVSPQNPLNVRAHAVLHRWALAWSDDGVMRFRASAMAVYMVLALCVAVWVGLKLHQSSISIWDSMHPQEFVEREIDLGAAKPIRSDEWAVFSPWLLGQVHSGMKEHLPGLGPKGAPLLASLPVADPLMLAQPRHWGFFLFDIERGFSWYWAYKTFGFIAAVFTLLLLVTRGDTLVSLAGAVALYGASFMQWWLSAIPSELVTGFSISVVAATYLLQARSTGGMWFGALGVAWAVPNLLLNLYPPYLLGLAYLAVVLMVGMHFNAEGWGRLSYRLKTRSLLVLLALGLTVLAMAHWYLKVKDAIDVMLATSYPGHRFSLGGEVPLYSLFYGYFESWKLNDNQVPFLPLSPPEASTFWHLFPIALLVVAPKDWLLPKHRLPLLLLLFCLYVVLWIAIPLPEGLRMVLAKAGWYLSPVARSQLSMAVASMLLVCVLISGVGSGRVVLSKAHPALAPGVMALSVAALGFWIQQKDPVFFTTWRVLLGAFGMALLTFAVQQGHRRLFALILVVVALPPLYVNPLQNGLASFQNKEIFAIARQVQGNDAAKWVVFGDPAKEQDARVSSILAQGLRASGMSLVNGTQYAPDVDFYKMLDPDRRFASVWNRYAHVDFKANREGGPMSIKTEFLDHIVVALDVCGPELRRTGVTHAAFVGKMNPADLKCLSPLLEDHHSGVSLYSLK